MTSAVASHCFSYWPSSAKVSMSSQASNTADREIFQGLRVSFVGKLGGLNRREAHHLVRKHGGRPVDKPDATTDLVVIGAEELPLGDFEDLLDEPTRSRAADDQVEIISETQFWQRLGLVDEQQNIHRLYTPAMLADLLDVPVAIIRRWHRRRLIVPAREVHRLPYFDFQEVSTAKRLAQLLAAGTSPAMIEKKLADLARFVPDAERPLAQLSAIIEGKQILLRQGEGLIEPGGQLRIDFDSLELTEKRPATDSHSADQTTPATDSVPSASVSPEYGSTDELLELAAVLEDEGQLDEAVEVYRSVLAKDGPVADVVFLLAELLYRMGDVTAARERYFQVIELDENYVEGRANLGCVLAELGQAELAVAAFEGALVYHPDYPDVHYHLARTLEEQGHSKQAVDHWRTFLKLAPDSPWADEARGQLSAPLG